ncbi:MAG: plastocyanin/azurin family copper-binding protein [Methanomassiliicoccales archaeon]|jgi:plastocyanin
MKQSTIIAIVVVVVVVVIVGIYLGMQNSSSNGAGNTPAADHPVSISNFAFVPNIITVHVGDTVTWKNNDGVTHTVTSDDNSTIDFNSGNLGSGSTFAFTFAQAGDFWYHCNIHSSMAHAIVRVLPAAA